MGEQFKMLAVDLGASSGRGIIGRFDGERLSLDELHRFSNDPVMLNGTFSWDIARIFYEIKTALGKCGMSDDNDIKSFGIDTWGVDYGLLDRHGRLAGLPHHYRDTMTKGIVEYSDTVLPKREQYGMNGLQFMYFNTAYQLLARLREDKKALDGAESLLFIPDLLNYFLTGQSLTEYTVASTSGLIDARTRNWSAELMKSFGIPESLFTPISQPGTTVGRLLPGIREELANKVDPKVVLVASHDTASAVAAVPAKSDDFVYISSGTWSLMGTELREPDTSDKAFECEFTNEGGCEHTIRFLKNIMGLWIEQESKRQWAREGKKVTYDQLSDMALAAEPLRSLINPENLLFAPPGDMPGRIAEYCAKTNQPVPETMGQTVRCIFDSLALKYRYTLEQINAVKGRKSPFIHIVGGGTKEAPLCRFAAGACGVPVLAGPTEATAIGNIALQAIAAGEIKDIKEARQVISNSFEIKEYEPENTAMWDAGYEKFIKLIESGN